MNHTPGPWHVVKTTFETGKSRIEVLRQGYSEPICHVHYTGTCNHWHYTLPVDDNAALIAAAPDLLEAAVNAAEALRRIAAIANTLPRGMSAQIQAAMPCGYGELDTAIAKAQEAR